jgi:hypothetical protein
MIRVTNAFVPYKIETHQFCGLRTAHLWRSAMLKKRLRNVFFLFPIGVLMVGLVACGGGGGGGENTATNDIAPSITSHPQDTTVIAGQTATFRVTAIGTAPLSYQWKKNGANVGTNSSSYTTPITTMGDNGAKFSVVVTNTAGHADSNEATLTVNASSGGAIIVNHTSQTSPRCLPLRSRPLRAPSKLPMAIPAMAARSLPA